MSEELKRQGFDRGASASDARALETSASKIETAAASKISSGTTAAASAASENLDPGLAKYAEILDLPHHESPNRPRMDRRDRAAQFAPFASLEGYEAVVARTSALVENRVNEEGRGSAFDHEGRLIDDEVEEREALAHRAQQDDDIDELFLP